VRRINSQKLPRIDQTPVQLIKVGGKKICSNIHKLIYFCLE